MKRVQPCLRDALARAVTVGWLCAACRPGAAGATPRDDVLTIDGSSTVFPISEAVAEVLQERGLETRITVGMRGTGGGLHRLCTREVDIANASRPILPSEEALCAAQKVTYIELPVALDGVAVLVNPANTWARSLTVTQLRTIWSPDAQDTVTTWRHVDPTWPDEPIHLFGAGTDSGTYDYFTKAIVGREHSSRGDFTSSEDDNVLVQGIAADRDALGFMGLAYYQQNRERMRLVAIDDEDPSNGAGPVLPSTQTVSDATYQPLARPVFLYVRSDVAARPEVRAFVHLMLGEQGRELMTEVGAVPLPPPVVSGVVARFDTGTAGSMFPGGSQVGSHLQALLGAQPSQPPVAP